VSRKRKRADHAKRYQTLLTFLLLCLAIVATKLVWIQGISAPAFAQMATDQRFRVDELTPRRGNIVDREGELLAVTLEARSIYVTPSLVKDPESTAVSLVSVLGGEVDDYIAALISDVDFAYIERKVPLEQVRPLIDLELPGIGFLEDYTRSYPGGSLASQILGFVGMDDHGLSGLELQYESLLAGVPGVLEAERDRFGRAIPGCIRVSEPPIDGTSLVLTIDRDIQFQAERALAEAVEWSGAVGGSVVVMDPITGELLAMASLPTFDPNTFSHADQASMRNRPVTDVYEPGSTMKAMTAAAVLEADLFTSQTMFTLPSTVQVADRVIHESHHREEVIWSLEEIIAYSSNVGAVELGQTLGEAGLYRAFVDFGFSERTGIDFPGEAVGTLPVLEDWSGSSIGNIPFGQGMSVTVLQLARAMAMIANGGDLVTPHFLKEVPGVETPPLTWPIKQAMSASSAAEMREVLTAVVEYGTGSDAAVSGYTVAGKTGTAQKPDPDRPGYSKDRYVASFAGFLPAEDPGVLIVVTIDEPSASIYGGPVAGPAFSDIAAFCMNHLKILPVDAFGDDALSPSSNDMVSGEGE